jgi:rRNA processing protein Krr1/Pno1
MAAHQHPDDRAGAVELITAAIQAGKPFCSRHRIIDSRQRVHTVVTIGEAARNTDGKIVKVRGYLIDVTDALHRDIAAATRMAVELSAETRAVIEQAKGALMITYGLDEDEAFALLRWHSQHANIKIRDIAAGITDRTSDPDIAGHTADEKVTEILAALTETNPAATTLTDISQPNPTDHDERLSA